MKRVLILTKWNECSAMPREGGRGHVRRTDRKDGSAGAGLRHGGPEVPDLPESVQRTGSPAHLNDGERGQLMMWKRILWTVFVLSILAGVSSAAQEAPPPVKLGLDSLVRAEATGNFSLGNFSFTPGNDEGRILFRLRPSVTMAPSENLTALVEGQWYAFYDDRDFSLFSLYQGYVEGVVPGVRGVSLKAGRQELVYGSTFLLGADTFYDGLTFDAAKLSWKPAEKFSIDLFGGQYVNKWAGGIEGRLYGIYAIYKPRGTLSADLYGPPN